MNKSFNFFTPTQLLFGPGRLEDLKDIAPKYGSKCLLVSRPLQGSLKFTYKRIEKLLNSENQSESVEELYKSNIRSTFYEPYSQMNLIRVISHQEILQNDSIVRVTLKSNGVLRYVFSVGSKEIFSSVYASGDTEYFNSSAQIAWYINPIYISEPTPTPQELNESEPTPKPGEVNKNKPIQPAEEIQSTTKTPELVLEQVDSVNTTQSRINISALISGFSAIILVVVIVLITYRFKGNKNGNN